MSAVVVTRRVVLPRRTHHQSPHDPCLDGVKGVVVTKADDRPPTNTNRIRTASTAWSSQEDCWSTVTEGQTKGLIGVTMAATLGREHIAVAVQGVVDCLFKYTNTSQPPHTGKPLQASTSKPGFLEELAGSKTTTEAVGYFLQQTAMDRALVFLTHTKKVTKPTLRANYECKTQTKTGGSASTHVQTPVLSRVQTHTTGIVARPPKRFKKSAGNW